MSMINEVVPYAYKHTIMYNQKKGERLRKLRRIAEKGVLIVKRLDATPD